MAALIIVEKCLRQRIYLILCKKNRKGRALLKCKKVFGNEPRGMVKKSFQLSSIERASMGEGVYGENMNFFDADFQSLITF